MINLLSGPQASRFSSLHFLSENRTAFPHTERLEKETLSGGNRPLPRGVTLALSICFIVFCAFAQGLAAQSAYFSGVSATLLSTGLSAPNGVAIDSSGNLFVADTGNNQVKEILAAGGYTTVNVLGGGYTFANPKGVAVDKSGNVFVADSLSNGTSNGGVEEILAAGGYSTVNILITGLASPYGVAVDSADNIFVVDTNNSQVKEFLAAASYAMPNVLGGGFSFSFPTGLALDALGNVFVSDDSNAIREILVASGYTAVNTLVSGYGGPSGIAVDASGNVFFSDSYQNHIDELIAADNYATVKPFYAGLNTPAGLAVDRQGNFFTADTVNNTVTEIFTQAVNLGSANIATGPPITATLSFTFLSGGAIAAPGVLTQGRPGQDFTDAGGGTCAAGTTFNTGDTCTVNVSFAPSVSGIRYGAVTLNNTAGTAIANVYLNGTGVGPQLTFTPAKISGVGGATDPAGIAVDGIGNLFVADDVNNAVNEIIPSGVVYTLGSGFNDPRGVALDGSGNIFVADTGNNAVKEILAAGGYVTVNTIGSGFNAPLGVSVDSFGNVFVADSGNNAVKEILASGGYSTTIPIGSGFLNPSGVATDVSGNVFVADSGNNAVEEIVGASGYTTVSPIGSGFSAPTGIAVDGGGNVFVGDLGSNSVKEILSAGGYTAVSTLGGTFLHPVGLTIDGLGNVFVSDPNNRGIAELDYADPPILSFYDTPLGETSGDSPRVVTLTNIGNAALTFPAQAGPNPTITSGFTLGSDSTCPQVAPGAAAGTLAAGTVCTDSISFTPVAVGADAGKLYITDDNLNAAGTQTIFLNATGIAPRPTITFNVPNHNFGDPPFMVTATSNSTGAITYSVVSGPATISGSIVTLTGAGTVVLQASEAADANFSAGTQMATFNVAQAMPTIVFNVPNHTVGDPPFMVSATSNSTGAFTYSVVSGPATISGATVTLTGAGTVVLQASEAMDANYAAGSQNATFTVTGFAPTITFSVPNHVYGDSPFVVSATSNSTGAFTYSVVSGPATIAGATVTLTGIGTVVLQASEAASSNYSAASKNATFTVTAGTGTAPTIIFTVPNHQYGDAPFLVSASSNSSGAFVYSVVSGPATIAGATVTVTGAGQVVLEALEAANGSYSAGSAETTFTVAGSIMLTATPATATVAPSSTTTFTITATPGGSTTFANALNFAAYGLPDGSTAVFAPATLAAGSAAASTTLTVQTSATASSDKKQFPGLPLVPVAFAFLMLPLFGIKSGRSALRKMSKRPMALLILLLSIGAVLGMTGCGTGFYHVPHKYDIAVIATDAVTGATGTTEVSIIVQ